MEFLSGTNSKETSGRMGDKKMFLTPKKKRKNQLRAKKTHKKSFLQQTPPPPKDSHFQTPQRTPLRVWESQKIFAKIFPKYSHEAHFYVQLTMFCPVTHKNLLPD